ncbi:SOS response-associated peptidase [Arenicella sp. 4NH20-0111]|uniref:SOS response-associated peptidase n=1 Tax=Arenicella sp. 4NH20-0111 TaxID=3127648 RepID=UPI0033425F4A
MCGRYNEHLPKMHGWSNVLTDWPEEVEGRFNAYPTSTVTAFAGENFNTLRGHAMRWQLVPSWAPEFSVKFPTHNARLETVEERPTFKNAWVRAQRCLIPMAGFYERQQSGAKQWHYIHDAHTGCLVVAGLYERWHGQNEVRHSCTMITKPSTSVIAQLHHRSPVLLTKKAAQSWLNSDLNDPIGFLSSVDDVPVTAYPISSRVGNAKNNDAKLIHEEPKIKTLFD